MTGQATLAHGLMLKNEWSTLRSVALKAGFVLAQERYAAAFERLLNIRPTAFHCHPHVRVMAVSTTHFAFQNRVAMRQLECRANFQVTLETSFRRLARIDNSVRRASAFYVQTARPVARLTANILRVLPFCLQSRVRRCSEIARDFIVACVATV
jgi:hypothetical protein